MPDNEITTKQARPTPDPRPVTDGVRASQGLVRMMDLSRPGASIPARNRTMSVQQFYGWNWVASRILINELMAPPLRMYARAPRGPARQLNFSGTKVQGEHAAKLYDNTGRYVQTKLHELGDDLVELTEEHPALRVLRQGNPYVSGKELERSHWLYAALTGDSFWLPVFNPVTGTPDQVYVLPSQWVEVVPDPETFIRGYWYGADRRARQFFGRDQVLHYKFEVDPEDPFRGRGVMDALHTANLLSRAKREEDLSLKQNRSRPDWIAILKDQGLDGDEVDAFTQRIKQQLGPDVSDEQLRHLAAAYGLGTSPRKRGNFLAVAGEVDFQQLSFPDDDIGDSDRLLQEIATGWGVPFSRLVGNQNSAGGAAEQGDRSFIRGSVRPNLEEYEEFLNEQYLPLWGPEVAENAVLAFPSVVPEDRRLRIEERRRSAEMVQRLAGTGTARRDELRAIVGLEPLGGEEGNQIVQKSLAASGDDELADRVDQLEATKDATPEDEDHQARDKQIEARVEKALRPRVEKAVAEEAAKRRTQAETPAHE